MTIIILNKILINSTEFFSKFLESTCKLLTEDLYIVDMMSNLLIIFTRRYKISIRVIDISLRFLGNSITMPHKLMSSSSTHTFEQYGYSCRFHKTLKCKYLITSNLSDIIYDNGFIIVIFYINLIAILFDNINSIFSKLFKSFINKFIGLKHIGNHTCINIMLEEALVREFVEFINNTRDNRITFSLGKHLIKYIKVSSKRTTNKKINLISIKFNLSNQIPCIGNELSNLLKIEFGKTKSSEHNNITMLKNTGMTSLNSLGDILDSLFSILRRNLIPANSTSSRNNSRIVIAVDMIYSTIIKIINLNRYSFYTFLKIFLFVAEHRHLQFSFTFLIHLML